MSVAEHDVSRRRHELPRLDRMVTPRWLREHRRAQARAAHPDALAAGIAQEVVSRSLAGRGPRFEEIIRAQGVRPFDAEDQRGMLSPPTSEEWEAFRAALAEGRER